MTSDDKFLPKKKSIHETLVEVVETVPGWSPPEQLLALYSAVVFSAPMSGDIVEIGAWCGRSTVALGLAAREVGCRVYTADVFPEREDWSQNKDGTWSIRTRVEGEMVEAYSEPTMWDETFKATVLPVYENGCSPRKRLDAALKYHGLSDIVEIRRTTAAGLRKAFPQIKVRLLFLDGDHDEKAVGAEIEGFLPKMCPGGMLCFDDAFTVFYGVDQAVTSRLLHRAPPILSYGARITRKMYIARLTT